MNCFVIFKILTLARGVVTAVKIPEMIDDL